MTAYQRHGGDHRSGAPARRASKIWLLSPEAGHEWGGVWFPFGGDGQTVPCFWCQKPQDFYSLERDRINPGFPSYARKMILPSCSPCNKDRGVLSIQEYSKLLGLSA